MEDHSIASNFEIYNNENGHVEFKEQPLKLIEVKNGKFSINEEAMNLLRAIEEEIIVVTIVGKELTGKSSLLNLLLEKDGSDEGVFIKNIIILVSNKSKHK
jgi:tRNA U34 5-carboxymethylaminomethyl modifying GTPase MnmE/TrmE